MMTVTKITAETVTQLAFQARVGLDEARAERMRAGLNAALASFEILGGADTDGVEPMTHVFAADSAMRPDEVRASTDRAALLRNAPVRTDEAFTVPKTVE